MGTAARHIEPPPASNGGAAALSNAGRSTGHLKSTCASFASSFVSRFHSYSYEKKRHLVDGEAHQPAGNSYEQDTLEAGPMMVVVANDQTMMSFDTTIRSSATLMNSI